MFSGCCTLFVVFLMWWFNFSEFVKDIPRYWILFWYFIGVPLMIIGCLASNFLRLFFLLITMVWVFFCIYRYSPEARPVCV